MKAKFKTPGSLKQCASVTENGADTFLPVARKGSLIHTFNEENRLLIKPKENYSSCSSMHQNAVQTQISELVDRGFDGSEEAKKLTFATWKAPRHLLSTYCTFLFPKIRCALEAMVMGKQILQCAANRKYAMSKFCYTSQLNVKE